MFIDKKNSQKQKLKNFQKELMDELSKLKIENEELRNAFKLISNKLEQGYNFKDIQKYKKEISSKKKIEHKNKQIGYPKIRESFDDLTSRYELIIVENIKLKNENSALKEKLVLNQNHKEKSSIKEKNEREKIFDFDQDQKLKKVKLSASKGFQINLPFLIDNQNINHKNSSKLNYESSDREKTEFSLVKKNFDETLNQNLDNLLSITIPRDSSQNYINKYLKNFSGLEKLKEILRKIFSTRIEENLLDFKGKIHKELRFKESQLSQLQTQTKLLQSKITKHMKSCKQFNNKEKLKKLRKAIKEQEKRSSRSLSPTISVISLDRVSKENEDLDFILKRIKAAVRIELELEEIINKFFKIVTNFRGKTEDPLILGRLDIISFSLEQIYKNSRGIRKDVKEIKYRLCSI